MNDAVDVAIVGAGPYGLSLAAHLQQAGVSFRIFGEPMHPWQTAMPAGMFLKSQGFASNLSDPAGTHTLEAFCASTGRPYKSYGLPVPLDTFIAYGRWFQQELVPALEETIVTGLVPADGGYELTLAAGETARARQVVVAAGIEHFAHVPEPLASLPADACTHSSQHTDLSKLAGRSVVVVGGGQSALESAALLHEQGAAVQVVMREPKTIWNGPPLALDRPLLQRLREPEAGLGSGWGTWLYSNHPDIFRHLPEATRVRRARTALGPAGAAWLRERVEGEFPVLNGQTLTSADAADSGVKIGLTSPDGDQTVICDHVVAATGYRVDLGRLAFLGDRVRAALDTVAGTPAVGSDYQSSLPGLYFIGPGVAPTFGPVMRFVFGADHAARRVAARLARTTGSRTPAVGASR